MADQQYVYESAKEGQEAEALLDCIASMVKELSQERGMLLTPDHIKGCLAGFVAEKRKTLPVDASCFQHLHAKFQSQLDQT